MAYQSIYEFFAPTKQVFGPHCLILLPKELRKLTGRPCPLLVTDPGIVKAGLLGRLTTVLEKARIRYGIFDSVEPNPSDQTVHRGYECYREAGCNALIALGGGSPIDTAKAIGVLTKNPGRILDYVGAEKVIQPLPPFICVPTTYGTGSEVTPFVVITDPTQRYKCTIASRLVIPHVAILDPELLLTLPLSVGGPTGMDALTHAIESYVNLTATPLTESLAIGAIELISQNLRQAVANDHNLEATGRMLVASTIAGMAFAQTRVGLVHAMAHPLGGFFNVHHGTANAILLPHVMEHNLIGCPEKFVKIAEALGESVVGLSAAEVARRSIDAVRRLSSDVRVPLSLRDVGVDPSAIPDMARDAMTSGNIPVNPRRVVLEDVIRLYEQAM
ncbi:MAG: iron-containing alcohol dehydrogenase [Candidatus Latescibacteria bacterium]|nr:iron-containing alcohol dehydrogenase [Candidatus Latescibacterota bacterium]